MNQKNRNDILEKMIEISKKTDENLDTKLQKRENMTYYNDFKFRGSNLGAEKVYIIEISNQRQKETGNNTKKINEKEKIDTFSTYEIYDEDGELIATVEENGKIHFTQEYLEQLKGIDERIFQELNIEDLDFVLPEELQKSDLVITDEELKEHEQRGLERERDGKRKEDTEDKKDEQEGEKEPEQETEEEKKAKAAETLGIDASEIESVCTINTNEKITDKEALKDIMPEAAEYEEVQIVHSKKDSNHFTMIGIDSNANRQQMKSIDSVEGTTTNENVISVNEDGTEVTEKQVKGLMRINARNRDDGIAISTGNYGMMDIDYVSNVMNKELRRATPIRTREAQNQRVPTAQVKENAGDSKQEMEKEGRIFRAREKEGIDPQSLDGIDTDQSDSGNMTLEELKEQIKEKALDHGEMSKEEAQQFIKKEIAESGLALSEEEINMTTQEIQTEIIDESRFPTRGNRT